MNILSLLFSLALMIFSNIPDLATNYDRTAPRLSWEIVQPGILGVTADDTDSMPARLAVSLDGGQTWQVTEYPIPWATRQVLTPSVTWNVHLNNGINLVQIHATDKAGNTSQAAVEIAND